MTPRLLFPAILPLLLLISHHHSQAAALKLEKATSTFSAALAALQKEIGYGFRTVDLLGRAMTHPSYSLANNRALALLGIGAIDAAAALRLLQRDPDTSAADLSRRIDGVSGVAACASAGGKLGLGAVVRVAPGTNASEPSVVCGAFRALFGAVTLDSGSADAAGKVFWAISGSVVAEI